MFMRINTSCFNFDENWTFAELLGGWEVPLVHERLTSTANDETLIITTRAGLMVTITGKSSISACRIVHWAPTIYQGREYFRVNKIKKKQLGLCKTFFLLLKHC
jgi:hypothetical protein